MGSYSRNPPSSTDVDITRDDQISVCAAKKTTSCIIVDLLPSGLYRRPWNHTKSVVFIISWKTSRGL